MDFDMVILLLIVLVIIIVGVNTAINGCPDCMQLEHCSSYELGSGCLCCTCEPYIEKMIHINGRYYYSSTTNYVYLRESKPLVAGEVVYNRGKFEQVFDEDGNALTYDEYLEMLNIGGN